MPTPLKSSQQIKLWTIQTPQAVRDLFRSGRLRASVKRIEPAWLLAYRWMAKQMELQVGPPPRGCNMPIWAWYQWSGIERARPDLRARGHLAPGQSGVRLELSVQFDKALLSDFELWHFPLNYWYLPKTVKEGDAFEKLLAKRKMSFYRQKPLPDRRFHAMVEESWVHVFDLSRRNPFFRSRSVKDKTIQACLWEIRSEWVVKQTRFIAR